MILSMSVSVSHEYITVPGRVRADVILKLGARWKVSVRLRIGNGSPSSKRLGIDAYL